ncbi:MAG: alanine--tRNA ligase-related protein, partial [Candidatus Tectomicrobia bacterium]|nr:alanine--tRNA ligase-related protein [Candidatus Tectomicrobia bacterium]
MTELLCHRDSYVQEFDACGVQVNANEGAITLDQTAFYPGGGGQPCDTGVITVGSNTVPVTKVKGQGSQVWHWIDGALPSPDASVHGRLDWERR